MNQNSGMHFCLKFFFLRLLVIFLIFGFVFKVEAISKENLRSGVYLYKFTNYRGQYYYLNWNDSQIPFSDYVSRKVGYVKFDNAISSIRLVGISSIAVYTEGNFKGNCETITKDTPNLNKTSVGNNTISSVKINARCTPSGPTVTLYDKKDFKGRFVVITGDVPDLGVSNFKNKVASFTLNNVRSISVFNNTHYQNKCQTFKKNYRSLAGTEIGLNSIASIKLNAECIQYKVLTIKNRSGLLIQVFFPREYNPALWGRIDRGEKGKKEIASGAKREYYIEPNERVKFHIKALMPIGDLAPLPAWEYVCTFEFKMNNNITITAKGSFFKEMNCEKTINY